MPKVSVVIPNFNNSRYLKECIQSVLDQTLKDIEAIIVDDCSTDNSWEILQQIERADSRVKIIKNQQNSGAGFSRNAAIDIATGEYIKFLDSDDTMDADVLEIMYNMAKEHKAKIVCGYMQTLNKDGTINKARPLFYKRSSMLNKKKISPQMFDIDKNNEPFNVVGIGDALYSRQLFEKVRFPKLKWEDLATIPIIKYGVGEMLYIDKAVYNYRHHETNTTETDHTKKYPQILDIIKCCDILRKGMPHKYQEKVDAMEYTHVGERIFEVCKWKDCRKEDKEKIISALYQIIKIDVPNYSKNKFISQTPLVKDINDASDGMNKDNSDLRNNISNIKKFEEEPIDIDLTRYSNYDETITVYKHFVENMELLYNSPNDNEIKKKENGKEENVPRVVIENRLMKDLEKFYDCLRLSNDYTQEQKDRILNEQYKVCLKLVPNAVEHLMIPSYPQINSYLLPEFESFSKQQCIDIIDEVVHSSEFQKYSMTRMAAHSLKKVPSILIEQLNTFKSSLKNRMKGRDR